MITFIYLFITMVGDHSGGVQAWNFSNGAEMATFQPRKSEITDLLYIDRSSHPVLGK